MEVKVTEIGWFDVSSELNWKQVEVNKEETSLFFYGINYIQNGSILLFFHATMSKAFPVVDFSKNPPLFVVKLDFNDWYTKWDEALYSLNDALKDYDICNLSELHCALFARHDYSRGATFKEQMDKQDIKLHPVLNSTTMDIMSRITIAPLTYHLPK